MEQKKFLVWKALVDSSIYFALGGMKAQGMSDKEAWDKLKNRWRRCSQEHHRVNLRILRKLYAQGNKA